METSRSQQGVDKQLRAIVCSPVCHVVEEGVAVEVVVEDVFALGP